MVLSSLLQALGYKNRKDWEACLPATVSALRSVPHEATGFSSAKLVIAKDPASYAARKRKVFLSYQVREEKGGPNLDDDRDPMDPGGVFGLPY
ncbi:hypothetical protein HPB51_009390 [Rhipicephalus microplus]|uniref:Uncharacterized protein n=1 Tax=Rhipicephalus microplus TaxID=6941 RepID=A0A9J6F037_RHIMP|nr:hypothetical protein HPB51_009390 [Rhipicephalus microplus]